MPNLIDPNSTIEFKKLKLKEPFSLSSPASDDYLCAFDANDGELSKTNISARSLKLNALHLQYYDRQTNGYDTSVTNPAYGHSAILLVFRYMNSSGISSYNSFNTCVGSTAIAYTVQTLNFDPHTANILIWFDV